MRDYVKGLAIGRAYGYMWGLAFMLALLLASGCQSDREGITIDLTALARSYRASRDRPLEREQMERLIERLPVEQLTNLGLLYEQEGLLDEAAHAYQLAIWREPRAFRPYVNLGNVLRAQGKNEEALLRYRQAMNLDSQSFEAANNFADLCAEEGRYLEEAIERLEPLLERAGALRLYGLDTLGWLYHLAGDDVRARELLAATYEEAGNNPELRASVEKRLQELEENRHLVEETD